MLNPVELCDECFSLEVRGEGVDGGRHHPAGAAPVGVEVDGDRDVAFINSAGEGLVGEKDWTLQQDRLAALSALRAGRDFAGVDAIPCVAELTANRELFDSFFCLSFHPILWSL
jgi:hypothetical protein